MFETIKSQLYIGKTLVQQNELEGRGFSMKLDVTDNSIKATLTAKADITMQSLEISTEKDFDDDDLFFANGYQSWSTTREYCRYDTTMDLLPLGRKLGGFAKYACGIMSDYSFGDFYGKTGNLHSYTYTYFRKKSSRHCKTLFEFSRFLQSAPSHNWIFMLKYFIRNIITLSERRLCT